MNRLKFSIFGNKRDTNPQPASATWQKLCNDFKRPQVRTQKDGWLFSPAIFDPAYRLKENVVEVSMLIYDIDHNAELQILKDKLTVLDSAYAIYSTHSHLRKTDTNPNAEPRYRVCLPLKKPIQAKVFPFLWQYAHKLTQLPLDENAKDASRMFYMPAIAFDSAPYELYTVDGKFLDWQALPLDSFDSNDNSEKTRTAIHQTPSHFVFHEERHAELCRRFEMQAKSTGRGTFEMKCPSHNGNSNSSLFYDPAKQTVACIKKPNGCSYFDVLAAFGLPNGRLPNREHTEKIKTDAPAEFTGEPKPLDLTLKPVAALEDDCLPKVLTDWLRPASKVIGCPFDFLVLSAVIMVGSLIGSRLRLKPLRHSDWFNVANLYGGCVGLPSTKKTPALDETRKPILELQAAAREVFKKEIKEYEIDAKFYEKDAYKNLKESATKADYKAKMEDCPQPPQPILRRYETNDITTPKLAHFLAENPNGILQTRDELTGWLKSLEADYDLNARSFILELWKGAISYTQARVGNGEIHIQSGTLSIIGGIQPSKLQRYISEAYSFDNSDGLPQRFLFAYPDTNKRTEKPTEADYRAMQKGFNQANEFCKKIAEYDFNGKVIGSNGDVFHIVKFSDDAQAVVDEWQSDTEAEAESLQIEDEAFSSYLYKLPKSCFAIALIFHCLENIGGNFQDEITLETALKAIAYTEVLTTHARRVFALGENQIFSLAQILIGKIKKGDLEQGFTAYEIKRKQWSGLKTPETIKDVIGLLLDYGYLLELPTSGEGRPTVKYAFHPSLDTEKKDEME